MRWNLPNTLTVLRLLAAPALVLVYELLPRPFSDWIALGLFVTAALTDYIDGYLARRWQQTSNFGKMLDPIADKAMTIIALVMLAILLDGPSIYVIPTMIIIFREVFISGLREFLGSKSAGLAVTKLAKWKTMSQMVAVSVLFGHLLFEHYYVVLSFAMEQEQVIAIINDGAEDIYGLRWKYEGWGLSYNIGIGLLWIAAALTLITGVDYFRKSLPYLKDDA
ncbi:MAG: cardiolipin synthase [Paracoccaceae bacterium]|jgi:cardiolipin synthase